MLLKDHEPDLRSALGIPSPSGKALSDLMKDIPLDQDAKMVLARAVNEAEMDNSFYVYTDHLLCGMLRFPNDASVALESIQLNLESTRAASRRHRTKYPTRRTFYHRLFGNPFRAHRTALLKLLIILIAMILGTLLVRWLNY